MKNDLEKILSDLKNQEFRNIFEKMGISRLYLVGSFSRGENTENSDIDFIYKRKENFRIGGFDFIRQKNILEQKLNKKIDLVNEDFIFEDLKKYIEKDKILIY